MRNPSDRLDLAKRVGQRPVQRRPNVYNRSVATDRLTYSQQSIMTTSNELWQRYCDYLFTDETLGFSLDISRVRFPDDYFESMQIRMTAALAAMRELESGLDRQCRRKSHGRPLLVASA